MSGQWEVVGKKKGDKESRLPVPKGAKPPNNQNLLNNVKIEEVLPKSQLQSLYGNKNKENNRKNEKGPKEAPPATKKPPTKKEKVAQEAPAPKPKPPKSIESALNLIVVDEFKAVYEKSKSLFPDNPIIWLKDLAQFLCQKVPVEVQDPFFTNKPNGYPLNIVPSGIKSIIDKSLKELGNKSNAQLFFNICLNAMATDLGKNLPAVGYRFYLQAIARNEPKLIVENLSSYANLRTSYQNRANIGLAILWAVGQVAYTDFNAGLTVFQDLFLPLLDHKNYSRPISQYLLNLLDLNHDKPLAKEQYLLILDTVYSNKKNMPQDLKKLLQEKAAKLPVVNTIPVELFLKKIALNSEKGYRDCLCEKLMQILKTPTVLASWNKVYQKNLSGSAVLLAYIVNHWRNVEINRSELKQILENFSAVNKELSMKKRMEEGLLEAITAIREINEKMTEPKPQGSSYKSLLIKTLIFATFTWILYDIRTSKGWEGSKTAALAKEYKICDYSHLALAKTKEGLLWLDERIETTLPGYKETVVEVAEPYVELLANLGLILKNAGCNLRELVVEKYPGAFESVESWELLERSRELVSGAYETSVLYFSRSVDYLKEEVFVGQLSPENVQKVIHDAFNTTQRKAVEYYHWIYEKVQTTINIPVMKLYDDRLVAW